MRLTFVILYSSWTYDMFLSETDSGRKEFYSCLKDELLIDEFETVDKQDIIGKTLAEGIISKLVIWVFRYLDDDEGTVTLLQILQATEDVFGLKSDWSPRIDDGSGF